MPPTVPAPDASNSTIDREPSAGIPILEEWSIAPAVAGTPAKRRRYSLFVTLVAFLIFFPFLGSFGLWDPWETHYGEVTRNMVENRDWVAQMWGYDGQDIGKPPAEQGPFMSKPGLIFWSEGLAVKFFGLSTFSIRFPMALLGFLVVLIGFRTLLRITDDPPASMLGALVIATCPQFYLISRQAQTDMPFVGTMSIGLFLFLNAVFSRKRQISDRSFILHAAFTTIFLLLLIIPQAFVLATDARWHPTRGRGGWWAFDPQSSPGIVPAILCALVGLIALAAIVTPIIRHRSKNGRFEDGFKDLWSRNLNLYLFFAFIALATIAKGLLGFLLPGAIIFLFLLISGQWGLLAKVRLVTGTLLFLAVAAPWYIGMFIAYGKRFWDRFFVHDHFNRFGAGVHQVDTGLFEHFIKWLGIGMFPWSALVPVMLLSLFTMRKDKKRGQRDNLKIFLFIWTFFAYALFTKSSTKFHHYIFPALVPLAVLIGLWLRDLPAMPKRAIRLAALVGIGFTMSIGWTIHDDRQALRNLMTYKYDRPLPKHLPVDPYAPVADGVSTTWEESRFFQETPAPIRAALTSKWGYHPNVIRFITGFILLSLCLLLIFAIPKIAVWSITMIGAGGFVLAIWALNVYMPMLSPSWSQHYIFEEYYSQCDLIENPAGVDEEYEPVLCKIGLCSIAKATGARSKRVCKQDIVSWLFTWRGETFYSNNNILPIAKREYLKNYLDEINYGQPFYALLEGHRRASFKKELTKYTKQLRTEGNGYFKDINSWDVYLLHAESPFFVLVRADPVLKKPSARPTKPARAKPTAAPAAPAKPAAAPVAPVKPGPTPKLRTKPPTAPARPVPAPRRALPQREAQ